MYFSTDRQNNFYLIYHIKFTQNKDWGCVRISKMQGTEDETDRSLLT